MQKPAKEKISPPHEIFTTSEQWRMLEWMFKPLSIYIWRDRNISSVAGMIERAARIISNI